MVSIVGSDAITLSGLLETYAKQGGATVNWSQLINGIITDGYLPILGAASNSWIALFKKVHDQYDAKAPFDGNVLYGEAVGYTFVQAMPRRAATRPGGPGHGDREGDAAGTGGGTVLLFFK